MGFKIFDELSNEENDIDFMNTEVSLESLGEVIAFNESLDENIRISSEELVIATEVYNVYDRVMQNISNIESGNEDLADSVAALLSISNETGYDSQYIRRLKDNGNHEWVSVENIIAENRGIIGRLGKMVTTNVSESISAIVALPKLLMKYNTTKLMKLKTEIENGDLVPRTSIDKKSMNKFNNKLGIFYSFGYDITKDPKDLITYMSFFVNQITKEKMYTAVLAYLKVALLARSNGNKVPKDKGSSELFSKLKVDFKIKPSSDDFKFGMLMRIFGNEISMMSIAKDENTNGSSETSKNNTSIGIHSDFIQTHISKDIGPTTKEGGLSILNYGISGKNDIDKAVTATKKQIGANVINGIINNLTKKIPIFNTWYEIFVSRFYKSVSNRSLIILKEMINYDKIIIEYINLTFERK